MNRIITYKTNEAIQFAHSVIPKSILNRLYFDYFIGSDPIFAGISNGLPEIGDGRSYRDTPHVSYVWNQTLPIAMQKTTIVIPELIQPVELVHEIGHVLDEYCGFVHNAIPITEYAKIERYEAFAEAFTAFFFYDYATILCKTPSGIDAQTEYLFRSLMRGND